ncbi:MAG: hypothetical protein AB7S93_03440 [Xanthobacteraceae bacterium]
MPDRDNRLLYELFNAFPDGKGWKADSGAIWDRKKKQVRPARWTSADAAGLPILPGLVRYDEVVGKKALEHAVRFTLAKIAAPICRRRAIGPAKTTAMTCRPWACACAARPDSTFPDSPRTSGSS